MFRSSEDTITLPAEFERRFPKDTHGFPTSDYSTNWQERMLCSQDGYTSSRERNKLLPRIAEVVYRTSLGMCRQDIRHSFSARARTRSGKKGPKW